MTSIVLRGSLIVSVVLTFLLLFHGFITGNILTTRVEFAVVIVASLFLGELLIRKRHYVLAGWVVMALYILLSSITLLLWGLNAPVGILGIGFVIFLSGVMLGPKHIVWVVGSVTTLLFAVQYIHSSAFIKPELKVLAVPSDYFDVLAYVTIFGVFALLSWLSGKRIERSLNRARVADDKLRAEKENLVIKLDEQSRQLHDTQLQEMVRLYNFAEIGQSTTATLHELSNLLSVLTLDIHDISQRHQRSKAITNAKDGIEHINRLVRQTRRQLHDNRNTEIFNAIPIIEKTIKDLAPKFELKSILLIKHIPQRKSFKISGDTLNLSQVTTILLNNALDACLPQADGKVIISVIQTPNTLTIQVTDNGPGISKDKHLNLFRPHQSTKSNGLGIGLYITKHIVNSQLHGKISLKQSHPGASFIIELPRYIKSKPTH